MDRGPEPLFQKRFEKIHLSHGDASCGNNDITLFESLPHGSLQVFRAIVED
jgi:hypothetical protein